MRALFTSVLTLLIFSLWAFFALLVINPYLVNHIPGYRIGRICIWEFVALLFAGAIAYALTKKLGIPKIERNHDTNNITLNSNYAKLFLIYFLIVLVIAIWQFWLFSLKY